MRNLCFCLLAWCLLLFNVHAASNDRIVAVVNEDIITLSELKARTTLAARAMGVDLQNPQAGNALLRRTLSELVDEVLQRQYAAERSLLLTKSEVQSAKDEAVSQMGTARWTQLTKGLGKAADDKLRAEATWARLMAVAITPRVQLGTAELDKLIEEMSKTQNPTEKNLSMIFIPQMEVVTANEVSGSAPRDVQARVEALYTSLVSATDGSAAFVAAAKANSAAPSAKDGGALGWLTVAEIPSGIATAIQGLAAGELAAPLRSPDGWLLVRLNEVRTGSASIDLQPITQYQAFLLAAARPSETQAQFALEAALLAATKTAVTSATVAELLASPTTIERFNRSSALGWVTAEVLQPDVAAAISKTKPGNWTELLRSSTQLSYLFVAATRQTMPPAVLALRERVAQNLRANRTELEARRFMRELRQRAFVDIRL